ncbi:MAG: hypothetical protein JW940_00890, partial [Polyangiaceae bacterium]|nr:hypothetical protein [Polyangiaceae bacterium]
MAYCILQHMMYFAPAYIGNHAQSESPRRRAAARMRRGTELELPVGMNSLPIAYWLYLSALVLGSVLGAGALLGGVEVDTDLDADVEADLDADVDTDIEGDMDED